MKQPTVYDIELACDHHKAQGFAAYLGALGHDVTIGTTTGNYVDGLCTDSDTDASSILNWLWAAYCSI